MLRPFATVLIGTAFVSALLVCAAPASADTLLVDRNRQTAQVAVPARGMSMAQVEASFGVPTQRLDPRGGQKQQWPTINRWTYPTFTVYFEKNKVIDTVVNQASVSEVGPKPAIR